jgi:hypothetical protein
MPAGRRKMRQRGRRARRSADCQEGAIPKCSFATVPKPGRKSRKSPQGLGRSGRAANAAASKQTAKPVHRGEGRESALDENSANLTKRTATSEPMRRKLPRGVPPRRR